MRKKFDIKLVLVTILVLVLSVAMIACNDGKGNGGTTQKEVTVKTSSLAEFYTALKTGLKNEGKDAVSATDDLEIELDLSALIGVIDPNKKPDKGEPYGYYSKANLGIKAKLLLDRTATGTGDDTVYGLGGNTGVKLSVYNQSEPDKTVLAVTYLLNEPQFGYVEMLGQKIKVAFDSGYNDGFVGGISGAFSGKIIDIDKDGTKDVSVADVLNAALKGTGTNWEITTAIDNIVEVLGLVPIIESGLGDIQDMIDTILGEGNSLFITGTDGVKRLNIDGIMNNTMLSSFFEATKTEYKSSDVKRYELKTAPSFSTIVGFLPDSVKKYLTDFSVGIAYDKEDGDVENLQITVNLPAFRNPATSGYPSVRLSINDLDVEKINGLTATDAKDILDIDSEYKDTFDFGFETTINLKGLSLALLDPANPTNLDGSYNLKAHAMIDLLNKDTANKTKVFITLSQDGVNIAEIELRGAEKLIAIKIGGDGIMGVKGIVLRDVDVVKIFQKAVADMLTPSEPDKLYEDVEENDWNNFEVKIAQLIGKLTEFISTTDGKSVEVKASNIFDLISNYVTMDWPKGITDEQKAQEFIARILTMSKYDNKTKKYINSGYVDDFFELGIVKDENGRKITKAESMAIYKALTGGMDVYITEYKAANNNAEPSEEMKTKFTEVYNGFVIGGLNNIFAGSPAFGGNPANFLVDLLINGTANVKIGYDSNGVNLDASLGIKDKFNIAIVGGKLTLKADSLPNGTIEIPDNPSDNSWFDMTLSDFLIVLEYYFK